MKKVIILIILALLVSSCGIGTTVFNDNNQAKPIRYSQPARYNHSMSTNMPYRYNPAFSNQGVSNPNRGSSGVEKSGK